MDETLKAALTAEFEDATRKRDRLNVYLDLLAERLGVQAGGAQPQAEQAAPASSGRLPDDVLSVVYDEEFHGSNMPKAAETVLRRWSPEGYKRPLKTAELLAALRKGGLSIAESRVLYRSLYTAPRFKNIKGGRWGLAEWYPTSPRAKGSKAEETTTAGGGQEALDVDDSGGTDNVHSLAGTTAEPTREEVAAS